MTFLDDRPDPHWKLSGIDAYAGDERALAWIDDGHDDACRAWAAARRGPTLLISTDPRIGLLPEHADVLREWAASTYGVVVRQRERERLAVGAGTQGVRAADRAA